MSPEHGALPWLLRQSQAAKYSVISLHYGKAIVLAAEVEVFKMFLQSLVLLGRKHRDVTELREAARNIPDSALPGEISES